MFFRMQAQQSMVPVNETEFGSGDVMLSDHVTVFDENTTIT